MKNEKNPLDDKIIIRPMCKGDIDIIAIDHCPPWSTVQETKNRWNKYYGEQQENIRTVGVVEQDKEILGYGSLCLKSKYPHFSNMPEINDVWIYEEYRSRGLGTKLITWLEELRKTRAIRKLA